MDLDLLAAGLAAGDPAELLDTEIGPLLAHAGDEVMTPWIRHHRSWEAHETAFFRATLRPGHTFLDCGANVGWFTVLGARLVGPGGTVIAVEPEPANLALLRANVWLAGAGNVEILPVAAGTEHGLIELHLDVGNRGDHQVHPLGGGDRGRERRLVPVAPLDELLAGRRPDVVKIDAQGFDHEVVAGLHATLAACPAMVLLIEFWLTGMDERGVDAAGVLAGYREAGLDLALLQGDGTPRPCTDAEILDAAEDGGTRVVNLVAARR